MGINVLVLDIADGTTSESSSSEQVLKSHTIPARAPQGGKAFRFQACVRTTNENSTDTLLLKVRLGPTTLTGTVLVTTTAVDQTDNDISVISGTLVFRDADGASVVEAFGTYTDADAEGIAVKAWSEKITTLDLDPPAATLLELTATWSAAHADNDCAVVAWIVEEVYV